MIVIGLAAGSIACLLCIIWTCVLLARRKDDQALMMGDESRHRPPILPTTATEANMGVAIPPPPKPKRDKMAERNAALLAALLSVRGEVPLPPPSNLVSTSMSSSEDKTAMRNHSQQQKKRKLDEITIQQQEKAQCDNQQADSWKACGLEVYPSRPTKRAVLTTTPCHKRFNTKTDPSMSLFDAGEINEQQQQQQQTSDKDCSGSSTLYHADNPTPSSSSSQQTMEFAFSSPRCRRWRLYAKLRRSVSDETCAGTTTATPPPPGNDDGTQHV